MNFNLESFDTLKYDNILSRGLSKGVGSPGKQVCIEAAICETLGLPHGDDPQCVAASVRRFKIRLNDFDWSSPAARAQGLRNLGLAQLGSLGVVDDKEFAKRIAEKTIRVLIPKLFREVFPENQVCLAAALKCEQEGTKEAAEAAANTASTAVNAASAAEAAAYATVATVAAAYANVATVAANAAAAEVAAVAAVEAAADAAFSASIAYYSNDKSSANPGTYLILSAQLALEVLRELKSPGIEFLK